jgi:hypothetical protein
MIPYAKICHYTTGRLRLKIAGQRGDHSYFQLVQEKLQKAGYTKTIVNPLTGSVIIESKGICADDMDEFARKEKLFTFEKQASVETTSLLQTVTTPISEINANLKNASGEQVDLPIAIFIFLLAFGVIEILRGNFRMPPWYTAFWYAFGVFSKSIIDSAQKNNI